MYNMMYCTVKFSKLTRNMTSITTFLSMNIGSAHTSLIFRKKKAQMGLAPAALRDSIECLAFMQLFIHY